MHTHYKQPKQPRTPKGTSKITPYILRTMTRKDDKGCLVWLGKQDKDGYGRIHIGSRTYQVHRFYYKQVVGEIPDDLEIDHTCSNRLCMNIEHLEVVTRAENMRRMWAKRKGNTYENRSEDGCADDSRLPADPEAG